MIWDIFPFRSIKTRVTLFTLAIFLLGIWSLAFYTSRMLYEDTKRVLGEQQFSTVSMVAAEIDTGLSDRMKALEQAALLVTPAMLNNPAAAQTLIERLPALQLMFNGGIFMLVRDGTAIADYPLSTGRRGLNFSDRKYAIGSLKEGNTTIGSPVIGKALKSTIFSISVPIRDAQGAIIGALNGTVDLAKPNFLSRIADNSYGKTGGYLVVVPQLRTIVFATDKRRIMEKLPEPGVNPTIDRFIHGYEGSAILVNPLGVEVLVSARGIPAAGWYVVASLPTSEAFAPLRTMQKRMLIATVFLTLLAGGLTWWLLKRQLVPVFAAMKTMASLSETKEALQTLPVTSHDEIGGLIGGFNNLLETLEQRNKALRESLKRQQTILKTTMDGFWLVDRQGRLLAVNETYCRMSGYSEQELLSMKIPDLEAAESAEDISEHLKKVLEQGEDRFDSLHRRKDGSVYDVEISVQHQPDEEVFVAFVRDITARKLAEEEKRRLQAHLEQAQRIESVGTLAGGIAHDFNNVLSVITGYGSIAQMKLDPDSPLKKNIDHILAAADRAKYLIQGLLAFGRKQMSNKQPIDLNLIMRKTEDFLKRIIGEDIEFSTVLYPRPLMVSADANQIEQTMMNLSTNARDAMPQGGKLTIAVDEVWLDNEFFNQHGFGKPGCYGMITVSDTGAGMSEEVRKKIFEPFYTTKEVGKGSGLGLSIIYGIVKQHDGFITVDSVIGKGTTVRIYLPVVKTSEDYVAKDEETGAPAKGTETILLAEDEETLRALFRSVLEEFGYTVIIASDGEDAVAKFRENRDRIHLFLSDLIMPKKSGKEAYDEIKVLRPDIKAIFASGYSPDIVRDKTSLGDGATVIYKPISPLNLLTKVRDVLDGRAA